MAGLEVSVVMPTYRRPGPLRRALEALAAQDLPPAAFEVLVVDDEPSPATRALVEAVAAEHPQLQLRYLAVARNGGPAAARNLGIHNARAPIIALTDDDCEPAPAWLSAGLAAFEPGIDGIAGKILSRDGRVLGGTFSGSNLFYRREALVAVGGYDERYRIPWREDSDIFFRLLQHGCRLTTAPDAVVYHPIRADSWTEILLAGRRAFNDPLLHKNFPRLYRQYIEPRPPYGYYAVSLLGGAALALLAARRHRPAAIAGALWATLTVGLASRRANLTGAGSPLTTLLTSGVYPPLLVYHRLRGALHWRHWFV